MCASCFMTSSVTGGKRTEKDLGHFLEVGWESGI
jgi:hypothetical protein